MMHIRLRKGWAGALAALLMFAQAVYASEACVHLEASAARAVAMVDMPDCADMKSAASCLAQCAADSQSSGHPVAAIPDASAQPVLLAAAIPADTAIAPAYSAPSPAYGPAPPIRFCSFLL